MLPAPPRVMLGKGGRVGLWWRRDRAVERWRVVEEGRQRDVYGQRTERVVLRRGQGGRGRGSRGRFTGHGSVFLALAWRLN